MSAFTTDAIAVASPSGRMSKRALAAAQERIRQQLFGDGLQIALPEQPSEKETLVRQAKEFRELAARGLKPRAYLKRADELEKAVTPELRREANVAQTRTSADTSREAQGASPKP